MSNIIKSFLQWVSGFIPSFGALQRKGFSSRIRRQDLILSKDYEQFTLHLHQSLSPFQNSDNRPKDRYVEGPCILIDFKVTPFGMDQLQQAFEKVELIGQSYLCLHKKMEFEEENLLAFVRQVESALLKQ